MTETLQADQAAANRAGSAEASPEAARRLDAASPPGAEAGLDLAQAEVDALLRGEGLDGAPAAVAFFSFEGERSFIAAREASGELTPLIGFRPLPVRGEALLHSIAEVDENGPRLIANYERAFPQLTASIRAFGGELPAVESESLRWLLAACSIVLGMDDADVAEALKPDLGRLVRVDTFVGEHRDRYALDSRRLLRSAMSYRIADVPRHVVMRSVLESLGEYAATALRRLLRDWKVETVVCAGDLFAANRFIADRARLGLASGRLRVLFPPASGGR